MQVSPSYTLTERNMWGLVLPQIQPSLLLQKVGFKWSPHIQSRGGCLCHCRLYNKQLATHKGITCAWCTGKVSARQADGWTKPKGLSFVTNFSCVHINVAPSSWHSAFFPLFILCENQLNTIFKKKTVNYWTCWSWHHGRMEMRDHPWPLTTSQQPQISFQMVSMWAQVQLTGDKGECLKYCRMNNQLSLRLPVDASQH